MTTVFHSDEISCGGCTSTIEKQLSAMPGVSSVKGDPESKMVTVEHDESLSVDSLLARLDEIGFESTVQR